MRQLLTVTVMMLVGTLMPAQVYMGRARLASTDLVASAEAAPISSAINCLSTDKGITDHSDASQSGSLAWHIAATLHPPIETEILVPGGHTYYVGSDLTIPENITLQIQRGAILNVEKGATLTINGDIKAGPWRIFTGHGTISGEPQGDFVRPQWWGTDTAALQNAVRFKRVHLGTGTFTVDSAILIGSNTYITGEPGCQITSNRTGLNIYEGIFTNLPAGPAEDRKYESVKNVTIDGVKFKNTTATGVFGLSLWAPKGAVNENIKFLNCEAIGCGLVNVAGGKDILIRNNYCHSSTLSQKEFASIAGDFPKYDNQGGIYICGSAENCIISNNRILGPRCHGIMVVAGAVYERTYEEMDPSQQYPIKRVLIEGNEVTAPPGPFTAGGIFLGYAQDCRVIGNHVEGYGDVGIDFEGGRNLLADSNTLVNNGKNLALYGNNKNVTFSNNTVYLTADRRGKDSPFFVNSYSNGYDPPIVDLRNTEILLVGNTFCANIDAYEKPWAGAIVLGTAKRIYFRNNTFVNAHVISWYCDDLETVEFTGNSFYSDATGGSTPLYLAVSQRDQTEKQPPRNYFISNNRFQSANDADLGTIIQVDSSGGLEGTAPYCDLNIVIENNVVQRETTEGKSAITFHDNYNWGYADQMRVNCIIRNNVTNAAVTINIPEDSTKEINLVVEGNTEMIPTDGAG